MSELPKLPNPGRSYYNKGTVLAAIKDSAGIVSTIARRLDCDWHTAQKSISRWQETRQAYEAEGEALLDFMETELIKVARTPDPGMIRYYLSTKGKKRGYTERQEITGAEGMSPLVIQIVRKAD